MLPGIIPGFLLISSLAYELPAPPALTEGDYLTAPFISMHPNPITGSPLPWTGDFFDGFRNRISIHAYANPDSEAAGAGFGVIRFDPKSEEVTFECWPRNADVAAGAAQQFPGWPITVEP